MSILVHAPAKVGKTTMATTAPPPICVLDVEGGWKYVREAGFKSGVKLRTVAWDPIQGPPPRWDGTWEVCHVTVREWRTLTNVYSYLARTDMHDFRSLVLDSVTESQRKLKTHLRPGGEAFRIQDWGDLLSNMDKLIRDMRDLVLLPQPNPLKVVVFIAETEFKNGAWRPAMQGQIGNSLPYWVDIAGYLFTQQMQDEHGTNTGKLKRLMIGQGIDPTIVAGERVQGALPDVVDNPHITNMFKTVFGDDSLPELTATGGN